MGAISHILHLMYGDQLQPANLRLVLPAVAAGAVLGMGGQVQRELVQLSQASIQMAPTAALASERVVNITGSCTQVLRATEAILSKVRMLFPRGPPSRTPPSKERGAVAILQLLTCGESVNGMLHTACSAGVLCGAGTMGGGVGGDLLGG